MHLRVAQQHVCDLLHLLPAVGRARRVRRRIEHEPFGLWGDRPLQGLRLQLEALLHLRVDRDGGSAADRDHLGIAHPIGSGDDHLVAGVERRKEGVEENVLAAGRDDRVGGLVVEAVLPLELLGDGGPKLGNAEHRRISGLAAVDRGLRRRANMRRRVEIGLADREADHLAALRLEVARLLRGRDRRGGFDAREGVGEEAHLKKPHGGPAYPPAGRSRDLCGAQWRARP